MQNAIIWEYLKDWRSASPSFLWVPDSPDAALLDMARGVIGRRVSGALVTTGGIANPVLQTEQSLSFDTNLGIGASGHHLVMLLVSVIDPSSVSGALFKLGNSTNGVAYGAGNPYFESSASTGIVLVREALGWGAAQTNAWRIGVNVLCAGLTSQSVLTIRNMTAGVECAVNPIVTYNAPAQNLSIGGYSSTNGRSSNIKVHAVAVWAQSFDNTQFVDFRLARSNAVAPLQGLHRQSIDLAFQQRPRTWVYLGAVSGETTHNDGVTETASATDTPTAVSTMLSDAAETTSASDTPTVVSTRLADTAETASAADAPTAVSTRLADVAETSSATDTPDATTGATPGIVNETASASDTLSAVSTRLAEVTETASASDTPDATTGATPGIVAETASASDTTTAVSTRLAAVAETASAADTPAAVSTRLASVAEVCSGAESTDGIVVPAGANVCAETASASDTVSCVIVTSGSIAEGTASATDVCSAVGIWSAFVAETAGAVDTPAVAGAGEVAAPAEFEYTVFTTTEVLYANARR